MQDTSLEERRASLPAEVHEYKELYFQLMRRVARFTEELSNITPTSAEEEAQLRFEPNQNLKAALFHMCSVSMPQAPRA